MLDLETMDFCPIELTIELISKKWTIQIIRDLFLVKLISNNLRRKTRINKQSAFKMLKTNGR